MFDAVTFGELLIDFTESGVSGQGNKLFEANPGGAVSNVLAMLNKLGHKTAFIGKVGNDIFGRLLTGTLQELGIDTTHLLMDKKVPTTLAFVANDATGERSFSFYREPGADIMFQPQELQEDAVKNTKLFHFGTLSMTHDAVRETTKKALRLAKEHGVTVSFDPNLRMSLWASEELAKEQFAYGMGKCDVLKISDNELQWFTGEQDLEKGIAYLRERYPITLILLTLGAQGSRAYYKNWVVEVPAISQAKVVDTTGAGDTFFGACLHWVLQKDLEALTREDLQQMLTMGNAAASLVIAKKGALKVMPTLEQIQAQMDR